MKKLLLSTVAILALGTVSLSADMGSFKNSTKQSKVSTNDSGSSQVKVAADADRIQLEKFASVNSDQLAKEIAAGNGEMVDTLATLLKVENKLAFASKLQANYGNIYTSQDMKASEVLNNISHI